MAVRVLLALALFVWIFPVCASYIHTFYVHVLRDMKRWDKIDVPALKNH